MLQTEKLAKFAEFIEQNLGLKYPQERHHELQKQLMFALKLDENAFEAFVQATLFDSRQKKKNLEKIAESLTVGETYFFRLGCGMEALENEILPTLIRKKQNKQQSLRIWSASCCRGDEPYSIAIMLDRLLKDHLGWNISIFGTDINKQFLHQAAQGIVSSWTFRNFPKEQIGHYFVQKDENCFQLKSSIRKMVTFAYLNLIDDCYPSLENNTNAQDIVLCNNTLYYFSEQTSQQIIRKLTNSLVDGGYLIVSTVEAAFINHPALSKTDSPNVFIKTTKQEKPVAQPHPSSKPAPTPKPFKPLRPIASRAPAKSLQMLYEEGDYAACVEMLSNKALNEQEELLLIRAYANLGMGEQVEELCRQLLEENSLREEPHLLLASILYEKNRYHEATLELKRTLFLNSKNVMAHFLLCFIMHASSKKEESKVHQREALKILEGQADEATIAGSEHMQVGHMREILINMDF